MEDPLLYVIAAVLAVFPGYAPAEPMKIHNVPISACWAYALHLRLVAVDNHIEFVVGVLYWLFTLLGRVLFIR